MNPVLKKIKENPLALLLFLLSLGVLGYMFLQRDVSFQKAKEGALLKSELELMQANAQEADKLAEDGARLNAMIQAIENRLMIRADNALNLRYFYNIQDSAKVKITSLEQNLTEVASISVDGVGFYSIINFNIAFSGKITEVISFLYLVRSGQCFARINQLTVGNGAATSKGNLVVTAVISVLGRKDVL